MARPIFGTLTLLGFFFAGPDPAYSPVDIPVEPFTLKERSGKDVSSDDLADKVWVAHFFFSQCNGDCNKTRPVMRELQRRFAGKPDVMFVSISVDPADDTPALLQRYAEAQGADPQQWLFLTGTETQVHQVIQHCFKKSAWRNQEAKSPGDAFGHTPDLLIIDRKGVIDGYVVGTTPDAAEVVARHVREVAAQIRAARDKCGAERLVRGAAGRWLHRDPPAARDAAHLLHDARAAGFGRVPEQLSLFPFRGAGRPADSVPRRGLGTARLLHDPLDAHDPRDRGRAAGAVRRLPGLARSPAAPRAARAGRCRSGSTCRSRGSSCTGCFTRCIRRIDVATQVPLVMPPRPRLALSAWCLAAAFGTYFCMYAFRKPFTAADYADVTVGGVGYKTVLVAAQVLGYTVSKFLGIKFIAEMQPQRRGQSILALVGLAELALLAFAVVPPPYNFVCLFFNGLPLGLVFGLVLGFLEGRRHTEALTAGLCTSFILADGATKSVGAYLLQWDCPVYWMPFTAGLLFLPLLVLLVWMLTRIPAPSAEDVAAQRARPDGRRRAAALLRAVCARPDRAGGAVSAGHDPPQRSRRFRSGDLAEPRNNRRTERVHVLRGAGGPGRGCAQRPGGVRPRQSPRLLFALSLAVVGVLLVVGAIVGIEAGGLGAFWFMVLLGLGLYLPYVVMHTTIFERLIAMTRDRGNIGYLMYLADAFGYLGYVAVMFARNLFGGSGNFLDFFVTLSVVIAAASLVTLLIAWRYFAVHPATKYTATSV